MKYFVKTDFVPERNRKYFTEGKEYLAELTPFGRGAWVTGDTGETHLLYVPECSYLDDKPWEIIVREEEEDEPSSSKI